MRPSTMLTAAPLTILLASGLATAPADAASAEQYAGSAHAVTNSVRDRHDRVRLRQSACLTSFADRQADRMAARREIFHQELEPILRQCGLSTTGENVASGYPTGRSAVRQGWMKSPPHRANILRREYRLMGIGAERGRDGQWYVAQVFGRKG